MRVAPGFRRTLASAVCLLAGTCLLFIGVEARHGPGLNIDASGQKLPAMGEQEQAERHAEMHGRSAAVQTDSSTGHRAQLLQLSHSCPGALKRSCVADVAEVTAASFTKYLQYDEQVRIDGWAASTILAINYHLAQYQHSKCMFGGVVEIGVHHGKHFLALASMAAPGEQALAMDLFEAGQKLNIDASGSGKRGIVLGHASKIGLTNVHTLAGDSMQMTIHNLTAFLPVRAFSVDGGHYAQATISDMSLAKCAVGREGYFVVDDFVNQEWAGVADGVFRFMYSQNEYGPFFWGCNKIFFAHRDVHAQYLELVTKLPFLRCSRSKKWHKSRYSLNGYEMCVHWGDCEHRWQ